MPGTMLGTMLGTMPGTRPTRHSARPPMRAPAPPNVTVIGLGNWGTALTHALVHAGIPVVEIVLPKRSRGGTRAGRLFPRTKINRAYKDVPSGDVLWICAPDAEVSKVADRLASVLTKAPKRGLPMVFHSSGVLGSRELAPLRALGVRAASVHPLMTFPRSARAAATPQSLAGVPFAIEGDAPARRVARDLVRALGGEAFSVSAADKPLYHAFGAFASPLLTAALTAAMQTAVAAGWTRPQALRRMRPMVERTVLNFFENGPENGFSGPIARGDVATVQRHLTALRPFPALSSVYSELSRFALGSLPSRNAQRVQAALRQRN